MEDSSDIQTEVLELTAQDDLAGCVPVMRLLRPHLPDDVVQVVARLRRQMGQGYRLLAVRRQGRPVALAGFRLQENLVFGRFVYVDDVVVDDNERRQGHAERLLAAVRDVAVAANCGIVALDTALSNEAAQRVYHRCGYETVAYHLIQRLPA